jgi:lipopolysaccharide export system protein LptA
MKDLPMTKTARILPLAICLAMALAAAPAAAQDASKAFKGFSSSSNDPIQIEADRLEVRDEEKVAIYKGNVRVRQGETLLKTSELRVHYIGEASSGAPGSGVDRIETGGPLTVQSGAQTASGDKALFEMAKDLVTLTGNVVLTEGDSIVRGDLLVVDLKAKKAKMSGGVASKGGGRVQTVINPNQKRK